MAVMFDSAGSGGYAESAFTNIVAVEGTHKSNGSDLVTVVPIVFAADDWRWGPFMIGDNELSSLTREVTYGDTPLRSLGAVAFDESFQVWLELFVGLGLPTGDRKVTARVHGGVWSFRSLRMGSVAYAGVGSIGDTIEGADAGTAMTISATGAANDRLVAAFGALSSISAFNGDVRGTPTSLLIGDAAGTGSPQNLTGTKQKADGWAGVVLPLYAASTVATADPLFFEPEFPPAGAHREQRTGGLQRNVFTVEAEV